MSEDTLHHVIRGNVEILIAGRVCGGGEETQSLLDVLLCRFAAFLVCFD
jgi:hypothetical protein